MFVQLCPESITMAGDSIGIPNIPGNVTRALAEDISYRTRELASLASLFLRHGRKRRLCVSDMNLALKWSDGEEVVGQSGPEVASVGHMYRHVPELDLFIETDKDTDLVSASVEEEEEKPVLEQETRLSISASWLHVEGSGELSGGIGLSGHMLQYYNAVINATMSDNELVCSAMMKDVATNSKISPILTYIITFIRHVMKRMHSKQKLQTRMLMLVSAIFSNPHLNLTPKPYLSHLVTALLEKVLCKDLNSLQHITLASSILSLALSRWATAVNQLRCQTLKHLRDVVTSPVDRGLAQYGAVSCLTLLGHSMLSDSLHPWSPQIWSHLDTIQSSPLTTISCLQSGALMQAGAALINHWQLQTSPGDPDWKLYEMLYKYFGDSLVPHIKHKKNFDYKLKRLKHSEPPSKLRLRKVRIIERSKSKQGSRNNDDDDDSRLSASQNFDIFADLGVPSDIFDEPGETVINVIQHSNTKIL